MYDKILIATDGSETAARAVRRGLEIASQLGSTVTLVTVASPSRAKTILDDAVAANPDLSVPVDVVADEGDPASVILDTADAIGADLVVVGNKGMQGARRFFLSSVPNKVAHHAPCAVLVVKTT